MSPAPRAGWAHRRSSSRVCSMKEGQCPLRWSTGAHGRGYTLGPEPESPCSLSPLGLAHLLPGAPEMQDGREVGRCALCRAKHKA